MRLLVFTGTSTVNIYKACACKNHFRQLVVKIQEQTYLKKSFTLCLEKLAIITIKPCSCQPLLPREGFYAIIVVYKI